MTEPRNDTNTQDEAAFEASIHDAYDAIEPSPEARTRMLAALQEKAAAVQAAAAEEAATETAEAAEAAATAATSISRHPKGRAWKWRCTSPMLVG